MTNFMQARAHAFGRALPRLKLFRMSKGFVAAAKNLGFHFGMNVVRACQFGLMLIEPVEKATAILLR